MKGHKCEGCPFRGEHQEPGFQPFGVCTREKNLIEAQKAYNAETCPYKDMHDAIKDYIRKQIENFPSCMRDLGMVSEATKCVFALGKWEEEENAER